MRARSKVRAVFTSIVAGLLVLGLAQAALAGPPSSADLSVTISDSPDPVAEGGEITYTISVSNAGPAAASYVTLSDTVQGGASYVRGSASQGSCTGGGTSANCSLGSLAKRASATVTLLFRAGSSDVTSTANVSSSLPDDNAANNEATTTTTVQAKEGSSYERLASCTRVAPVEIYCTQWFELRAQTVVRVTLDPAPGFTGYLFAHLNSAWPVAEARYLNGEFVSGTEEAFVTLSSGRWTLYGGTRVTPNITVGGGPGSSPEPLCTPGYSWFLPRLCLPNVQRPPIGPWTVGVPAVGAWTVTASA